MNYIRTIYLHGQKGSQRSGAKTFFFLRLSVLKKYFFFFFIIYSTIIIRTLPAHSRNRRLTVQIVSLAPLIFVPQFVFPINNISKTIAHVRKLDTALIRVQILTFLLTVPSRANTIAEWFIRCKIDYGRTGTCFRRTNTAPIRCVTGGGLARSADGRLPPGPVKKLNRLDGI